MIINHRLKGLMPICNVNTSFYDGSTLRFVFFLIIEKELDEKVNTSNIFLKGCFYELSNRLRKLKNNYKPLTGE